MIRSLKIENFRCFRRLTLGSPKEPLARVTLLAGMNNTGKTTVLEAVWISLGWFNPNLPFLVNGKRGLGMAPGEVDWLFHDREHPTAQITIKDNSAIRGQARFQMTVRPYAGEPGQAASEHEGISKPSGPHAATGSTTSGIAREITLQLREHTPQKKSTKNGHERDGRSRAILSPTGNTIIAEMPKLPGRNAFYIDTGPRNHEELSQQFSALAMQNRKRVILDALRVLDGRISDAQVLVLGGKPMVHVTIGDNYVMPAALLGQGTNKFLSFLLAVLNATDSVVLIDEFENGIHYSLLEKCWEAIFTAARAVNSQVFATTHSHECIVAAHAAAVAMKPYEFSLIRLDRVEDEVVPVQIGRKVLDTMVEMNIEMR